ncbi:MAG TPA: hypothetical protein VL326_11655 [Kofleriaceae bacterium]|nr:hypothetical protein [Kofleriaceae bacterium]
MREALTLLLAFAGCASAGSDRPDAPSGSVDATVKMDAAVKMDAPPGGACASGMQCSGSTALGSVSGDTMNVKLSAQGTKSAWYKVRVTEDNSSAFGLTLRVAARVTSPPGLTFHVATYVNTGSDVIECSTSSGSPTTTGNTEEIKLEWGEGSIPNGSDDGRDVSIEVQAPASGCSSAMWNLEVEGNWL